MSMPRQYFVDPRQQYMPPPQIPVYNGDPSFIPPNTNYPTGYPMPMTTQQMSQAASSSSRKLHKRSSSQDPRVRTNSNTFNPLAAIFSGLGGHHRSSSFPENNAQQPTFRPRANSHSHSNGNSNGFLPQQNGYPQQQQYPQQTLQVPPAQPIQLAHSAPREPIAHDFAYPVQPKQGLRHRTRSFSGYTTTQPNANQYQMPPGTYTPIQVPNGLLAPYMPAPQAHSSPGGGHRRSRTSSNPYNPNSTHSAMKTVRYSPNIVESTLNEINNFGSHRYPSVTRDTSRNRDGSTHRDSSRHRDTSTHRDTSRHRDPSLSRDPNTIHHTHQTPHHTVHTYQSQVQAQAQQFIPQPISNEHRGRESERDRDRDQDRDRGRDRSRGDKTLQTGISEIDKYLKLLPPAKNFCWSRCTGRRKAVCIGINYTNSSSSLKGCANDARHTRDFLIKYHNFRKSDIMLLTDDAQGGIDPTRKNIFDAMHWLVRSARKDDSLFFHYSGHGGQVPDKTGQEKDGMNEAIFPVDFKKTGEIIDDDLNKYLVQPLPPGCRLTAIFDSCHSGTVLDLPYLHSAHGRLRGLDHISHRARSRGAPAADIICFASCKDDETSADTFHGGIAVGAMSYAFIKVLKEHPKMTYGDLLSYLRKTLIPKYHQKAQLSTTHPLDLNKDFVL